MPRDYFTGERLSCSACHISIVTDPQIESGWTVLEMEGIEMAFCPVCFGNAQYLEGDICHTCGRPLNLSDPDQVNTRHCHACMRKRARLHRVG